MPELYLTRLGARLRVASPREDLFATLLPHLDAFDVRDPFEPDVTFCLDRSVVQGADPSAFVVCREGQEVYCGQDASEASMFLASQLEFDTAVHARGVLCVHAGVVGVGGRAIVLPGRSFAGKSTLVAALVQAGATYFSDEFAVVDAQGFVHPFRREIFLRSCPEWWQPDSPPPTPPASSGPLRPGVIARLTYSPDAASEWRPLTSGEAFLAILDNTVALNLHPAEALNWLKPLAEGSIGVEGKRGEAPDAAARLIRLLQVAPF